MDTGARNGPLFEVFTLSSYIDVVNPERHAPYLDIPDDVVEYLHYLDFVKLRSPRTVNGYYLDLRSFFRFMMVQWRRVQDDTPPEQIDLTKITTRDIAGISKRDIFAFLDHARSASNGPKARARKLSALKGFFGYLCTQVNKIPQNPTENVTLGTPKNALPKYLTVSECLDLLNNIQSNFYERDFCIITLFLNCGMRLSELVSINYNDIKDDGSLVITGKGNKERTIYLNKACVDAIVSYMKVRPNDKVKDRALFLSSRNQRISPKTVQHLVYAYLDKAGLGDRNLSVHKLRHTAATLMYQHGNVDLLLLKEILGHENLGTTEIYTHISDDAARKAIQSNPLSNEKPKW